jgi:hypothetical protein
VSQGLLEGTVVDDDPQVRRIADLELALRQMRRERDDAQVEAKRAKEDATRALGRLRQQLGPLYRAMQAVFGELDAAGIDEPVASSPSGASVGGNNARWDEWKARLGPSCGKVIDALLLGGEMNVTALTVACKMAKQTVYDATSKMGRAGILVNSGGKFSLKT